MPSNNLRGVGEGLLLAHLGGAGIEERDAHAEIAGADLERAAGAGGGLFKEQNDLLVAEPLMLNAVVFQALELNGEVDEVVDFFRGEVEKREEASAADVETHK